MADNINTAEPEANLLNISSIIQTSDLVNNINVNQNLKQSNLLSPNNNGRNKVSVDNKNHVTFYNNESINSCPKHCNESYTSYTTTDSDESSSSSSEILNRAPDGGWGWVVVFAAFMVNLIADGVTFSFGVIFIEFEKYFDEGKSKTAWIGSLFMSVPLLSGPVASFLTDRYGCQKVTIIGSIIASAGFVISAFADSLFMLFITFGFISGFGLSLCYVAAVVIVAYYFDKKRSFATGLSVCGSGIGTVIFAPLNHKLLSYYGWRGCTLILAGLFLNLCIFGMLMRDLPWTKEKLQNERKKRKHARLLKRRLKSTGSYDRHSQHTQLQTSQMSGSEEEIESMIPMDSGNKRGLPNTTKEIRLCNSLVNLPTFIRNHENVPLEVLEALTQKKHLYSVLVQNYPSLLLPSKSFSDSGRINDLGTLSPTQSVHLQKLIDIRKQLDEQSNKISSSNNTSDKMDVAQSHNGSNVNLEDNDDYDWWIKKDNPQAKRLQTAYLQDIKIHRHSLTYRGAMLNINRYRLRASSCPNIYRNSMTTIAKEKNEWSASLWELWYLLLDMMDFSHFKNMHYLLFAISNFLLYTWYDVPYVYLADLATLRGNSQEDASYLISMIGFLNMFGEVLLGWAGDKAWVNANTVYAISMVLCGIVIALVPLFESYASLSILSALFGLFISANYSFTSIILVEIITLERFTNAYGVLLLVQGIANLVGPPLAGGLYDVTQSYNLSFYLGGFFIAISGFLLFVYPLIKHISRHKRRQRMLNNHKNKIIDITTSDCKKCAALENDVYNSRRHSFSATDV
ncbi:monocarboxylate transporter 12-like [Adelges cooleyi]|uniref:monocarboxylate transporter 12-like n=1 Tax=Adelges cooleyi TaxID=133065 RepID=UPI00217F344A|nr:monocarboxylate transporter 12-like [Adelges cooleyi]XP_050422613.1 monocarboxylate transporter 12-like [Adelges cooleyi]